MDRNLIIQEYFQLIVSLNKGNKLKNEKTAIKFNIEELEGLEYRLLAYAIGREENNKIEISIRGRRGHWERSGFTNYINFEIFCADFLNKWEAFNNPHKNIEHRLPLPLLISMKQSLQNEFGELMISHRP